MYAQDDDWWVDAEDVDPIPTHQHPREFEELLALYEQLPPMRVLEIGSWHGGTLRQWIKRAPRDAQIVCIDPGIKNEWTTWANAYSVQLICLAGRSQDMAIVEAVRWRSPYDFAFIDGAHDYASVRADFENYYPMMAPGGVMAFHDILAHERYPGNEVRRVWDEIRAAGYRTQELIEDPAFSWGGIGLVIMGEH